MVVDVGVVDGWLVVRSIGVVRYASCVGLVGVVVVECVWYRSVEDVECDSWLM